MEITNRHQRLISCHPGITNAYLGIVPGQLKITDAYPGIIPGCEEMTDGRLGIVPGRSEIIPGRVGIRDRQIKMNNHLSIWIGTDDTRCQHGEHTQYYVLITKYKLS